MTKTLLATAFVAVLGAVAFMPSAHAASSGTINITGKVVADTCTINVNNSGTSTVALPTVMTGVLNAAGKTAGDTTFNVALSGCDTNIASAQMAFSGSNVDTGNGYLSNASSGGSNVEIELLSGSNVINTNTQSGAPSIAVSGGAGTTTLTARYIAATTAATAGLVSTNVNFTLTYQ